MANRRSATGISTIACFFASLLLLVPTIAAQSTQQRLEVIFENLKSPDPNAYSSAVDDLLGIRSLDAVPILKEALKDKDPQIRRPVVLALAKLLPPAEAAPVLSAALRDENVEVRAAAVIASKQLGSATLALPILTEAMKDSSPGVRYDAMDALPALGTAAIPALRYALKDKDPIVRASAADSLGDIGVLASDSVPDLTSLLADASPEFQKGWVRQSVSGNAADALAKIGSKAAYALPTLDGWLGSKDENKRSKAVYLLGRIGSSAAVPGLRRALSDGVPAIRYSAASGLGDLGFIAFPAVPDLVKLLTDSHSSDGAWNTPKSQLKIRYAAEESLDKIAFALIQQTPELDNASLGEALQSMNKGDVQLDEELHTATIDPESAEAIKHLETTFRGPIEILHNEQQRRHHASPWAWISSHVSLVSALTLLIAAWATSGILLWFWPLALFHVNNALKNATSLKLPPPLDFLGLAPGLLLGAGFLASNSRVLDAWVKKYAANALSRLHIKPTFKERSVYVDVPMSFPDGERRPAPVEFQPWFEGTRTVLILWGEGGSGKTSLACQMALWALSEQVSARLCKGYLMLPIFIEENLTVDDSKGSALLLSEICGRLGELIGEEEAPAEEFVKLLLKRRRVLVIIDGYSELDATTQRLVRPYDPALPINALLITSRNDERFGDGAQLTLHTGRLKGQAISAFVEDYLRRAGKREEYSDSEFYHAVYQLTTLVGDREITALLAYLFSRHMIDVKGNTLSLEGPQNIPALMDSYVAGLCRKVKESAYPPQVVHPLARKIAWVCLRDTLMPAEARYDAISVAIRDTADGVLLPGGQTDADAVISFVTEKLSLMQWRTVDHSRLKFSLDPLSEYLAARYLVTHGYKDNFGLWDSVFSKAGRESDAPHSIEGFLRALCNVCEKEGAEETLPNNVVSRLRAFLEGSRSVEVPIAMASLVVRDSGDERDRL